jgi:hypothetical protein
MSRAAWTTVTSIVIAVAMGGNRSAAQDEVVEVQAAVVQVVADAGAVGEVVVAGEVVVDVAVADEADEAAEQVQVQVAMPADQNLLKLRAYARVQAALARRVCELSEQQQKSFAEINDQWVDNIYREKQQQPVNRAQPGLIAMFFGAKPVANPRRRATGTTKQQVDQGIEELLTDEQRTAFAEEKERREQFRAAATADAIIASLQERLGMSEDQREAIKTKLVPWAKSMNLHMLHYFSGNNYYPNVPEHLLSPHLDDDQMTAYRGLQKHLFTDENFHDGNAPIVIKQ